MCNKCAGISRRKVQRLIVFGQNSLNIQVRWRVEVANSFTTKEPENGSEWYTILHLAESRTWDRMVI
jgi:hypothetical protein